MTKTVISTVRAPQPLAPYSQAIVANGFMFTAGFGPHDPQTREIPEGIQEQTRQTLRNLTAVLAERDLTLDDVVKVTVHLQDLREDFPGFNEAYSEFLSEPYPVRTTVGSQLGRILVEIDVVAALPA